jgi:hypothetical protein
LASTNLTENITSWFLTFEQLTSLLSAELAQPWCAATPIVASTRKGGIRLPQLWHSLQAGGKKLPPYAVFLLLFTSFYIKNKHKSRVFVYYRSLFEINAYLCRVFLSE